LGKTKIIRRPRNIA